MYRQIDGDRDRDGYGAYRTNTVRYETCSVYLLSPVEWRYLSNLRYVSNTGLSCFLRRDSSNAANLIRCVIIRHF